MMEYMNLVLETSEDVYRPSDDSFLSAEMIAKLLDDFSKAKLEVLDVGTGSGILGLVAAMSEKTARVVFSDADAAALELSRRNFEANRKITKAFPEFVRSSLLSEIHENESFDMIIFNAPYLKNEKKDEENEHNPWSGGRTGTEVSVRFLEQSLKHLRKGGIIILNASSFGDLERLEKEMERLDLRILERRSVHVFFEDMFSFAISRKQE